MDCFASLAMTVEGLSHLPLISDRAEMLVDAEDDQDEFRGDARKHHADYDAGDRGQQQDESAERTDRHRGQPREDPGQAEQYDQADDQPVESLDDRGRDEAVPLKQILKIEHRWFSGGSNNLFPDRTELSPNTASGKSGSSAADGARPWRTSHASGRVEIAANNGHIRASPQQSSNQIL